MNGTFHTIIEGALQKYNFAIDKFTNSIEAPAQFQKNPQAYSMLLADIHIPAMARSELAELAHQLSPARLSLNSLECYFILCQSQAERLAYHAIAEQVCKMRRDSNGFHSAMQILWKPDYCRSSHAYQGTTSKSRQYSPPMHNGRTQQTCV